MTIEHGAGQARTVVKIRTSRYALIQPFVMSGVFLVLAAYDGIGFELGPARVGLVVVGATRLWTLTFGVDLTPETVNLRGLRRRSISWQQVQAVIRYEHFGQRTVQLILENGKTVRLRAPISVWGMGGPASGNSTESASGGNRTVASPGTRCSPRRLEIHTRCQIPADDPCDRISADPVVFRRVSDVPIIEPFAFRFSGEWFPYCLGRANSPYTLPATFTGTGRQTGCCPSQIRPAQLRVNTLFVPTDYGVGQLGQIGSVAGTRAVPGSRPVP
jgi:hypothetical protein